MSHNREKDKEDHRLSRFKAFRVLDNLAPIPTGVVFAWLTAIAIGLIAVSVALAYELTESIWAVPVGVALGLSLAVLLGRDFLRWRLSWVAIAALVSFCLLFVVAYW